MSTNEPDAVKEWLIKAEDDWAAVRILLANKKSPKEIICFHCQQYVEKLLKGLLTFHKIEAPKTHFLRRLIQQAIIVMPELASLADKSDRLSEYAVQFRYPGEWREISDIEVIEAINLSEEIASIIKPILRKQSP